MTEFEREAIKAVICPKGLMGGVIVRVPSGKMSSCPPLVNSSHDCLMSFIESSLEMYPDRRAMDAKSGLLRRMAFITQAARGSLDSKITASSRDGWLAMTMSEGCKRMVSSAAQSSLTKQKILKNHKYVVKPKAIKRRPAGMRQTLGKHINNTAAGKPNKQIWRSAVSPTAMARYSNPLRKRAAICRTGCQMGALKMTYCAAIANKNSGSRCCAISKTSARMISKRGCASSMG